jgi:CheY-like chemotaxis protein
MAFKVLLIEDAKIDKQAAVSILKQLNCEVVLAETGAQALELIEHDTYQLILLDLGLPDIDGLTVAEIIREKEGEGIKTPIIALTSLDDEDVRLSSADAGVDDFIAKPLTVGNTQLLLEKYALVTT